MTLRKARLFLAVMVSGAAACAADNDRPDGANPPPAPPADGAAGEDTSATCAAGDLRCDPLAPFAPTLVQTGLQGLVLPSAAAPKPARAIAYWPLPELYSDGLSKTRYLLLPVGKTVNNQNRRAWEFPVGTVMVKTFFDQGPTGTPRPVETRLIRHGTDRFERFEYAVYKWAADGGGATLLDIAGNNRNPVPVTVAGRSFSHTIPSRNDCGECHDKNAQASATIIGFDEIRLNNRSESSGGQTQLEAFAQAGVFSAAIPDAPLKITDADPVLARVKTFVFGNCVHCHHGQQGIVDFRPDVFRDNVIGKPPESPGIAAPEGWARVVPGAPEKSIVYLQARGTNLPKGLRPMPQVGVEVRDLPAFADELEAMKTWIAALPPK